MLESALSQLQQRVSHFLNALSAGSLTLTLSPTRPTAAASAGRRRVVRGKGRQSSGEVEEEGGESESSQTLERIDKSVSVRLSDGSLQARALRQLSGGERRRVALAFALGFAEFAAQRSGTHVDLMVLDEVFQVG